MTSPAKPEAPQSKAASSPLLGLYMIVRDAEDTLPALLGDVLVPGGFDEIVLVDTGSVDGTRGKIEEAVNGYLGHPQFDFGARFPETGSAEFRIPGLRVVLARFKWIDDFSAARQFAFDLGTAQWRGYLDADDRWPGGPTERGVQAFRRDLLANTIATKPDSNVCSIEYLYSRDEMIQDVRRFVRWADGWKWHNKIHEHMIPSPEGSHGAILSVYRGNMVEHDQTDARVNRSLVRNIKICKRKYDDPSEPRGERALMAYFLAEYAWALGDYPEAIRYGEEAARVLVDTNMSVYASVRRARIALEQKDAGKAIEWAGFAVAHHPDMIEGWIALGLAHRAAGHLALAIESFQRAFGVPDTVVRAARDLVFEATGRLAAVESHLEAGQVHEARQMFAAIPQGVARHDAIRPQHVRAGAELNKVASSDALRAMWETYVAGDQPLDALELLRRAPAYLRNEPWVADLIRLTEHNLRHVLAVWPHPPESAQPGVTWYEYTKAYAELPPGEYPERGERHDAFVRGLGRAVATREWAQSLPAEGPEIHVLSIGPNACVIEEDVLASCPRIRMTVADVAPQASKTITDLVARFPGRVSVHEVKDGPYDWPEGVTRCVGHGPCVGGQDCSGCDGCEGCSCSTTGFDAIFFFEVVEHLPDYNRTLRELRDRLAVESDGWGTTGTLWLSTPNPLYWLNRENVREKRGFWPHVQARGGVGLWGELRAAGLNGSLRATDLGMIFLARVQPDHRDEKDSLAILVPNTPQPFDPRALDEGHIGGSEEAVVHLAPALARAGWDVTVYAPMPERWTDPRGVTVAEDGVLWRSPQEFDAAGEHGAILLWRSPQLAPRLKQANPLNRVFNWLHDAIYQCPAETYRAADGTIVLSQFHADVIDEADDFSGPFSFAANGIDPASFPPPDETKRDLFRCVYASSPDRGLEKLLEAWPLIVAAVPQARLDVYYSWAGFEKLADSIDRPGAAEAAALRTRLRDLLARNSDTVTLKGGVGHAELHKAYREASLWCYPCTFEEISCISAMKAMAAGCLPIVSDVGALPETLALGGVVPGIDHKELGTLAGVQLYAQRVITELQHPIPTSERAAMREKILAARSWDAVARMFDAVIS